MGVRVSAVLWAVVVLLGGCTVSGTIAPTSTSNGSAPRASTSQGAPAPTTHPSSGVPPSPALRALARLPVKGRAPMTGYDRAEFGPPWTDATPAPDGHNGCDTRNDILRRDLVDITLKAGTGGCLVLSGTLRDPYTAVSIGFVRGPDSWRVQIDHVVALGDAWQKGAQRMTFVQRETFANDPLELLAVDGRSNEQKGDGDAATWLPPNKAFRCAYVARQIAVKQKYRLWLSAAEADAMRRVLARCPGQSLPSG